MSAMSQAENPFFESWSTPFGAPPFDRIRAEHFFPAYDRAFKEHQREIEAIAADKSQPTFENTIATLERSGSALRRVGSVFSNIASSNADDAIQAIERDVTPKEARHRSAIYLNEALYRRIAAVYDARDRADLTPEQKRLVERIHTDFVRSGAKLEGAARQRLAEIVERLSVLSTGFRQNLLADTKEFVLVLDEADDLAGLPEFARAAAAEEAKTRGLAGKWVITLQRSSAEPFLEFSTRRDLREKVFKAWTSRGDNKNTHDNNNIMKEILRLRLERARLLGYKTHADYVLADTMAKTVDATQKLMTDVWAAALRRVRQERDDLQSLAQTEGLNQPIAPWDWRYFEEKQRVKKHALDQETVKSYLQLERLIEAKFYVAKKLFSLSFVERPDIPVYHPDVRVWEVKDADGKHRGLFYGDYFARPAKQSGAWMSSFRDQERLAGNVTPLVINNCNYSKPAKGEPALLSLDEARTLFHEFGHGLHGLLSEVTYPSLSGTNVSRDFVELPSQLYEHWFLEPQILERFAIHHKTGKPMPKDLIGRIVAARTFGQGFATIEYTACALLDVELHKMTNYDNLDLHAFEREALKRIEMPEEIAMRHRLPHFIHLFADGLGDGYSAGYYSYLWSQVLDTDGFGAFKDAKDPFDPKVASRLRQFIYSGGNTRDPMEAYVAFRGRPPTTDALLEHRGLDA
jgi:peptidyl-dipeptidase Dcp